MVRVRVWIVWYMDAQRPARFGIADPNPSDRTILATLSPQDI